MNLKEQDKIEHIKVTTLISLISGIAIQSIFYGVIGIFIAIGIGMIVGFGKEIFDSREGGTGFDWEDIVADLVGSTIGGILSFILSFILLKISGL